MSSESISTACGVMHTFLVTEARMMVSFGEALCGPAMQFGLSVAYERSLTCPCVLQSIESRQQGVRGERMQGRHEAPLAEATFRLMCFSI
jgi:hypothetical protein